MTDKRKGMEPVPDNLGSYLNDSQLMMLKRLEGFGWDLKFLRRPLFLEPVAVMWNAHGNKYGVLEEDGSFNTNHNLEIRAVGQTIS